jgi:hypothetical protein
MVTSTTSMATPAAAATLQACQSLLPWVTACWAAHPPLAASWRAWQLQQEVPWALQVGTCVDECAHSQYLASA